MPHATFFNLPEAKRQRLLDILLDEFADHDYKNVSIGRITRRAGIAKGSFYQYFADKKDCYLYLIQLGLDEKKAFLQQTPPPATPADLFSHLRWLLQAGLQFQFSNPQLAQIGYKAIFDDAPLPAETLQLIRRGSYTYFLQLVQQGLAAGDLNPDIHPHHAAFLLNAVFTNLGHYLLEHFAIAPAALLSEGGRAFEPAAIRQAIEHVISLLESGLKSHSGS